LTDFINLLLTCLHNRTLKVTKFSSPWWLPISQMDIKELGYAKKIMDASL